MPVGSRHIEMAAAPSAPPAPEIMTETALPFAPRVPFALPDWHAWAFFLDLDGTLIDLAPRPQDVVCPPGLPATLAALEERLGGALAIVTGRPADFAAGLLGAPFTIAGLHGAEIRQGARLGGGQLATAPGHRLAPAARYLAAAAARMEGVVFEDKGAAIALHFRLAPQHEPQVERAMAEALALAGAGYRLQHGKAVAELCPAGSDKGQALHQLMTRVPFRGRRPLAVGDDLTDEAMFAAAHALGGLSLRIGTPRADSRARHTLPAPQDFRGWLARLTA